MPRFRDIRGGGGIRPPMSYIEFERPCRLGLNGEFTHFDHLVQGLLIVEVVKSDTRSDESSKQVSSYICKYPIKGGPVQHRKPVQRGKQARRGDTCRNSYMNCHIEYDKKHGSSLPLLFWCGGTK